MSRAISYYCSCSTCTRIRNEQPKSNRFRNLYRYLLTCSCCSSKRNLIIKTPINLPSLNNPRMSAITFRDIDITNKHCSKHDVLVKASRSYHSRMKNEAMRRRVRDANQRWTRMSILSADFSDFIFNNKDFIPLCTICYENLSTLEFNLCHTCIKTLLDYQQTNMSRMIVNGTNYLVYS